MKKGVAFLGRRKKERKGALGRKEDQERWIGKEDGAGTEQSQI